MFRVRVIDNRDREEDPEVKMLMEELNDSVRRRRLVVLGIDGKGEPVSFINPVCAGIQIGCPKVGYSYRLDALLRPICKRKKIAYRDDFPEKVTSALLAIARRHKMAGKL